MAKRGARPALSADDERPGTIACRRAAVPARRPCEGLLPLPAVYGGRIRAQLGTCSWSSPRMYVFLFLQSLPIDSPTQIGPIVKRRPKHRESRHAAGTVLATFSPQPYPTPVSCARDTHVDAGSGTTTLLPAPSPLRDAPSADTRLTTPFVSNDTLFAHRSACRPCRFCRGGGACWTC